MPVPLKKYMLDLRVKYQERLIQKLKDENVYSNAGLQTTQPARKTAEFFKENRDTFGAGGTIVNKFKQE